MSSKKNIALIFAVIALSAGAYYSEKSFLASQNIPASVQGELIAVSSTTSERSAALAAPTPSVAQKPQPVPNITLSIGSTTYRVHAPEHSSVLDAMKTLASTTDFTFSGRDYPSLGFFVDSINGKKAEKSHNWILYVNGKLSNTGASQTTLKAGDTVEWKYEKSY